MPKTFSGKRNRLNAALTGKGTEVRVPSAAESKQRTIIAVARRVTRLETQRRDLKRKVAAVSSALKHERRYLRELTQEREIDIEVCNRCGTIHDIDRDCPVTKDEGEEA